MHASSSPSSASVHHRDAPPDLQGREHAGIHVIADFWGVREIETREELSGMLEGAARAAGARVLQTAVQAFEPAGLTGAVILAESHISLHTWPEWEYAAVDAFTCGDTDPRRAVAYLQECLQPHRADVTVMQRGKTKRP